jgi:hypothetical protein
MLQRTRPSIGLTSSLRARLSSSAINTTADVAAPAGANCGFVHKRRVYEDQVNSLPQSMLVVV